MSRFPVAVLGATGMAGRQALRVLQRHPWFEVAAVAASSGSAGRALGEVLDERAATQVDVGRLLGASPAGEAPAPLPEALRGLRLEDVERFDPRPFGAVFSMLPSGPARAIEVEGVRYPRAR